MPHCPDAVPLKWVIEQVMMAAISNEARMPARIQWLTCLLSLVLSSFRLFLFRQVATARLWTRQGLYTSVGYYRPVILPALNRLATKPARDYHIKAISMQKF